MARKPPVLTWKMEVEAGVGMEGVVLLIQKRQGGTGVPEDAYFLSPITKLPQGHFLLQRDSQYCD